MKTETGSAKVMYKFFQIDWRHISNLPVKYSLNLAPAQSRVVTFSMPVNF